LSGKIVYSLNKLEEGLNNLRVNVKELSNSGVLLIRFVDGDRIEVKKIFHIRR
jgi:hypothetical protein